MDIPEILTPFRGINGKQLNNRDSFVIVINNVILHTYTIISNDEKIIQH